MRNTDRSGNPQSGNIFAMLFGAVALTGVLAAVGMQTLTGPITTITRVTQRNIADNHLLMDSKILINAAVTGTSGGDIDGDGIIEPAEFLPAGGGETPPTNGGFLPGDLGLAQTDPWGTRYGYCVWDHGASNSSTNRITGDNTATAPTQPVIAIIAAGADKVFQTSCGAYSSGEVQVTKVSGSDDIIQKYTYAEASASSNGLWTLNTSDDARAELKPSNASTPVGVSINRETGIGDFLGITTSVLQAKIDDTIAVSGGLLLDGPAAATCGAEQKGAIRLNASETSIEICDGANTWSQINTPPGGSAGHVQFNNGSGGFGGDASLVWDNGNKRLGIGTATPSQALDVAGNTNVSGDLSAGGALAVTGAATLSDALSVTGNTTLGDGMTDTVTIAGNTGIGGTLGVAGATALSDVLTVAGDTTLQDDLSVAGDTVLGDDASDTVSIAGSTGIGGTLGVAGVTTLSSSLDVTGATTLSSTLSVAGNAAFDTNTLFVNATGNAVGVGTATPAAKLDVAGGVKIGVDAVCNVGKAGMVAWNSNQLQVCDGTTFRSISAIDKLDDVGDVYLSESGNAEPNNNEVLAWNAISDRWEAKNISTVGSAIPTPGGSDKQVQFNDGGSLAGASELVWDKANNRLGIGATAPRRMLDVAGSIVAQNRLTLASDATTTSPVWNIDNNADTFRLFREPNFSVPGTVFMTVLSNGNVGIGTATPQSMLQVAGGIQLADDTATCPGTSNVKLGTMRFSGGDLQVCKSGGWSEVNSGGDSDTLSGLSCATNEIPKWNGTAWACAADGGGSGSDDLNGTWLSSGGFTQANGTTLVPANGSYNLGNMPVEKGVYLWLLYNCGGQLTYSGPSIGNSIDIVGPTVITSSDTWADLSNVPYNSCGIFYTGIFKSSGSGTASVRIRSYFNSPNYSVLVKSSAAAFSARVIKISGGNGSGGGSSQWTDVTDGLSYASGGAVVGAGVLDASAILQADSTTKGFLPPRMTTAQRDAIASPATGLMVFNSTAAQYQFWNGTTWSGLGSGAVPTGTIAAFALASCPTGWTEYTAARGRFLRGIDNGAGNDPSGTRAPGSVQADDIKSHLHSVDPPSSSTNSAGTHSHDYNRPNITASYRNNLESGSNGNQTVTAGASTSSDGAHTHAVDMAAFDSASTGGVETRPKNVAVLFCQYTGSGGSGGVTTLAHLTDVDLSAVANGNVLTYNSTTSKWEAATPSGGIPAGSVTGAVQFRGSSAVFAADDANLVWDNTNKRLGIGTTSPARTLDISGTAGITNAFANQLLVNTPATGQQAAIGFASAGMGKWQLGKDTTDAFFLWDLGSSRSAIRAYSGGDLVLQQSGGNVGIGTTAPMGPLHVVDNGGSGRFYFDTYGTNGNALILRAARPGPSGVRAGDQMATFGARPYAGSDFVPGATSVISIVATENQTATAQGNAIVFTTTNNGTAAAAERVRIDQNGNVGIGTATPQSLLQVAATGYAQFSKTFAGAPTAADCDAAAEAGRVTYDTTSNIWYVCEGIGGWGSTAGADSTFMHLRDVKAQGANGDVISASAWQALTLNTTSYNSISGASLSSNQISLPAGSYKVNFTVPVYAVGTGSTSVGKDYAARLQNLTSATTLVDSISGYTGQRGNATESLTNEMSGTGFFTLASPSTLALQLYVTNAVMIGNANNIPSRSENYTNIIIERIGN